MSASVLSRIKTKRQYLATIIVNLSIACMGASMAWTSPMEPKLKNPDESPLTTIPTATELSWIGSILTLGSLTGPIFAGVVAQRFGRKVALLASAGFYLVAYSIFLTATTVTRLLVGRFVQGCGIGFSITVTPMYVGEIATAERRGTLGSFLQTFVTLGMLFDYAVGPFVSYATFQWIQMALPTVFVAGFLWMPDTPQFYLAIQDHSSAADSLAFIRGVPVEDLGSEFGSMQYAAAEDSMESWGNFRDLFQDHANMRAFVICTGVVILQQLSGINPVQFFAQTIFDRAVADIPADVSAIVLGCAQIVASIVIAVYADRFGRRVILMASAAGMCCSLVALGTFFYLDNRHPEVAAWLTFLPVVSLVVFVFMFCCGFGSVTWILIGEMFGPSIKPFAAALVSSIAWTTSFLTVFFFKSLDEAVGLHWMFWIFAICCAVAFVFAYLFVMETRGLSLPEIQARLYETAPVLGEGDKRFRRQARRHHF